MAKGKNVQKGMKSKPEEEEEEEVEETSDESDLSAPSDDQEVKNALNVLEGKLQNEYARTTEVGDHEEGEGVQGWIDELAIPLGLMFIKWLKKRWGL
jgi:hypothetical protein